MIIWHVDTSTWENYYDIFGFDYHGMAKNAGGINLRLFIEGNLATVTELT